MKIIYRQMESPYGPLFFAFDEEDQLIRLTFLNINPLEKVLAEFGDEDLVADPSYDHPAFEQLEAYFRGERETFDLALAPRGTDFQRQVWDSLCRIPFGTCKGYGEIAEELGNPGASRAVGMANNKNPIPIIIPCHRVIGAKGKLVGFGAGLENKYALLKHEGYFLV